MNAIPTENQWEEAERTRLGLSVEQWRETTVDEDWEDPRPVIVMWGDSQETPTQRLERFHAEFLEAVRRAADAEAHIQEIAHAWIPEQTRLLIKTARDLIGPDVEDVDAEYIRAQAELIATATEPIPGLADGNTRKKFILTEILKETQDDRHPHAA